MTAHCSSRLAAVDLITVFLMVGVRVQTLFAHGLGKACPSRWESHTARRLEIRVDLGVNRLPFLGVRSRENAVHTTRGCVRDAVFPFRDRPVPILVLPLNSMCSR